MQLNANKACSTESPANYPQPSTSSGIRDNGRCSLRSLLRMSASRLLIDIVHFIHLIGSPPRPIYVLDSDDESLPESSSKTPNGTSKTNTAKLPITGSHDSSGVDDDQPNEVRYTRRKRRHSTNYSHRNHSSHSSSHRSNNSSPSASSPTSVEHSTTSQSNFYRKHSSLESSSSSSAATTTSTASSLSSSSSSSSSSSDADVDDDALVSSNTVKKNRSRLIIRSHRYNKRTRRNGHINKTNHK